MSHAYNLLRTEEEVTEMAVQDFERFLSKLIGLVPCQGDHGTVAILLGLEPCAWCGGVV